MSPPSKSTKSPAVYPSYVLSNQRRYAGRAANSIFKPAVRALRTHVDKFPVVSRRLLQTLQNRPPQSGALLRRLRSIATPFRRRNTGASRRICSDATSGDPIGLPELASRESLVHAPARFQSRCDETEKNRRAGTGDSGASIDGNSHGLPSAVTAGTGAESVTCDASSSADAGPLRP